MSDAPQIRLSDAERNRAIEVLTDSMANGQLQLAEFDQRSARIYAATYRAELAPLLEDLVPNPLERIAPGPPTGALLPSPTPAGPLETLATQRGLRLVTGEPGTSAWSVALMGGATRRHWVVPRRHNSVAIMGGVSLNLTDARFEAAETTITVTAIMGGVDITVPEGVRVIVEGLGIMGGFDASKDKSAIGSEELGPGAPLLRVRGVAFMGGVTVRTKRTPEPR